MTSVILSLIGAASGGTSNLVAGLAGKKYPPVVVSFVAFIAGIPIFALLGFVVPTSPSSDAAMWGAT